MVEVLPKQANSQRSRCHLMQSLIAVLVLLLEIMAVATEGSIYKNKRSSFLVLLLT